jgi:plasmid stabilization system protein ParE
MKLRFRPEARQDLRDIGDYIARDDGRAARRFVRMLREKCALIGRNPHGAASARNSAKACAAFPLRAT